MEINPQNYALYRMTRKSRLIAYVIGALLGVTGLHMAYIKEYRHFVLRLFIFLLSVPVPPLAIVSGIIFVVDFFLTWYMVEEYNNKLKVMYQLPIDV